MIYLRGMCHTRKVLEHFKEDTNPLKYRVACLIIENMPTPHTLYDEWAMM